MKINYFTKLKHIERESWRLFDADHTPITTWEAYNAFREGIVNTLLEEVEVPLTQEIKELMHSIVFYGVMNSIDNWTIADFRNNQE